MNRINLLKKRCTDCRKEKVFTLFYPAKAMTSGRTSKCTKCTATFQKKWEADNRPAANAMRVRNARKRRAEAVDRLGGKCCRCGNDDARVLQIDHVFNDGARERRPSGPRTCVASRVGLFIRIRDDEEGRYQLLCANCHSIKTWEHNMSKPILANEVAS